MIEINASTKEELRAFFKSTDAPIDETEKARVVHLVSEAAAMHSVSEQRRPISFWRFLIGQLRFVNPLAWAVQIALLVGMLLLVDAYGKSESSMLVVMIAAVLSVAIATPSVFKSFESNMAELEASCRHDSAQVLVSRLILFGLADVLWMSLAAWLVPAIAGGDPFRIFLYAATPFFAFSALCFHLSRTTNGRCVKVCAAAAVCVIVTIWASDELFPHWYSDLSLAIWSGALAVALALAFYEARRLVSQAVSNSASRQASLIQM